MTSQELTGTLTKLEFPAILDRLAARCRFSVAAERARELLPSDEEAEVRAWLELTSEAVDLLTAFPDTTIGGARDVRDAVVRAGKGGRLQPQDLMNIGDTVSASRALRRSMLRLPDVDKRFPRLRDIAEGLADLPGLQADIARTLGPRGEILDSASDELGRIRRAIRIAHNRLTDRLNGMISGGKYASAVQDAIVTSRDGRFVIPVKSEARGQVAGIIHDTSASGQTLFIEPLEVVELNNTWREEQMAEMREIERILDVLSDSVGKHAEPLLHTVEAFARIDLAFAKARLAFDMNATRPEIWKGRRQSIEGHGSHRILLKRARHPLLDPATVVPIDLELGRDYRVLLITGPNTGGKTVALKTVGLLTAMAQAGLFIPADDGSIVSIFPAIYVDIGDEQSIAQSLSTFSAHMRNVIAMLAMVNRESLVLLDELGAGTDPQEGSALARALVAELLERGALVVATTHYSEVKAFAYQTAGAVNASVEFDVRTLAPTYRLTIGVPGRSNALAIARRLGLSGKILDRAQAMIDPTNVRADALLEDIRRKRDETEATLKKTRELEKETAALKAKMQETLREAEEARRNAREEALAAAEGELAEARQTLRKLERDRELISATREHVAQRKDEVEQATAAVKEFKRVHVKPRPVPQERVIRVGDRVLITSLDEEAEVLAIDGAEAELQAGQLRLRQPLDGLRRLGKARTESSQVTMPRLAPPGPVSIEIDIRGMRAAEIEPILERYLMDAYRGGLPFVRIIHGKGTGTLRQVVRTYLHSNAVVARAETAGINEGGDGATVAYLREE